MQEKALTGRYSGEGRGRRGKEGLALFCEHKRNGETSAAAPAGTVFTHATGAAGACAAAGFDTVGPACLEIRAKGLLQSSRASSKSTEEW